MAEEGPPPEAAQPAMALVYPEDVVDKLKMLDYEQQFCKHLGLKPLHPIFLMSPSASPSEQFFTFTNLVSWLLSLNGQRFEPPDQFADPNATAVNVLDVLRAGGFPSDFPPNKIRTGFGDMVCVILDALLDSALQQKGIAFSPPVHEPVDNDEPEIDEGDETADMGSEANLLAGEVAEQSEMVSVATAAPKSSAAAAVVKGIPAPIHGPVSSASDSSLTISNTDPDTWKLEVERIAPLLKRGPEADVKEWRGHIEQTRELQTNVLQAVPDTAERLQRMSGEVSNALEIVRTREKGVQSQHADLLREYRALKQSLDEVQRKHTEAKESEADRQQTLEQITSELEHVKSELDSRTTGVGDSGPLVKLKDAMKKMTKELKEMELRLGVASSQWLAITQQDLALERAGGKSGGLALVGPDDDDDDDDLMD